MNVSGGLKAKGHPVGATGVSQQSSLPSSCQALRVRATAIPKPGGSAQHGRARGRQLHQRAGGDLTPTA